MQAPAGTLHHDHDAPQDRCADCGTQLADEINYSEQACARVCLGCHQRSGKKGRRRNPRHSEKQHTKQREPHSEAPESGTPESKVSGEHPSSFIASCSPHPSSLVPRPSSLVSPLDEGPEVEWLLAEHAAGRIQPLPVDLPLLPDHLSPVAEEVARFYACVRGLRLWAGDDRPVPLACGWLAAKLDIPKKTAWRARKALVDAGVLEPADPLPGRGKRGTAVYSPGKGAGEHSKPGRVIELRRAAG